MYSSGWLKTYRVNASVICVGNITTGGTGKTPLVICLCDKMNQDPRLRSQNCKCAILTRGYKTKKGLSSDEPAILAKRCPEARVIVNPDRIAAANEAVNDWDADILIMDDGFQHRRLHRDLDIVVIDAMCPFGYGRLLPAGLLREPVTAIKRADAVVVTRCDQIRQDELDRLEQQLHLINPRIPVARSIHSPVCARSLGRKEINFQELRDKQIFAFCGIGNPDAFLDTINRLRLNLVGSRIYNDHHRYTDDDIADIHEESRYLGADFIMTTQKDWSKICDSDLSNLHSQDIPFIYLVIELRFISGEHKITQLIENVLADKISKE
jgi:tetraacyldisaccharide 4'-kinase